MVDDESARQEQLAEETRERVTAPARAEAAQNAAQETDAVNDDDEEETDDDDDDAERVVDTDVE